MSDTDMIIAILAVPVSFLFGFALGFAQRGDDNGD